MIGKCWSVLTWSPGKFDSLGEVLTNIACGGMSGEAGN